MVVEFDAEDGLVLPRKALLREEGSEEHEVSTPAEESGPLLFCSAHPLDQRSDPAHEEFCSALGVTATISRTVREALCGKAREALLLVYPQCAERELFVWVEPPRLGGHQLANSVAKFESGLGATTDVQVRLFVCALRCAESRPRTSSSPGETSALWAWPEICREAGRRQTQC